ncbi:MAG: GNAT family N-acetyltransferase [Flavobacteriales bacterium]|nr:GNAT family N-acetyltransferase [Candidatus Arcticimaribacter sp.]|tara:strand:- start:10479 stop:11165 length:687 start_codon:yes stop_codon:yes gene_type:complete
MSQDEDYKLDNPIWFALEETHKQYAIEFDGCKFYKPQFCAFGGKGPTGVTSPASDKYSKLTSYFYMVGEPPTTGVQTQIKKQLTANQMLLSSPFDLQLTESIVSLDSDKQIKELYDLVNFVQPGFIREKTVQIGSYFGIYSGEKLIAASGERIKMNSFTEVSAVVTLPDFRKRGYAQQLLKKTTDKIFSENKIPILHVDENNVHAIKLYEKLGFVTRRKIGFCLVEAV